MQFIFWVSNLNGKIAHQIRSNFKTKNIDQQLSIDNVPSTMATIVPQLDKCLNSRLFGIEMTVLFKLTPEMPYVLDMYSVVLL